MITRAGAAGVSRTRPFTFSPRTISPDASVQTHVGSHEPCRDSFRQAGYHAFAALAGGLAILASLGRESMALGWLTANLPGGQRP